MEKLLKAADAIWMSNLPPLSPEAMRIQARAVRLVGGRNDGVAYASRQYLPYLTDLARYYCYRGGGGYHDAGRRQWQQAKRHGADQCHGDEYIECAAWRAGCGAPGIMRV